MQKKKINKKILIISLVMVTVVFAVMIGPIMSNVEHPKYKVTHTSDNIETRSYVPMIVAEVIVKGERTDAIKQGFRILADYIFGNNRVNQKIDMTAPVQQEAGQKIKMTAPVQQQGNDKMWKVRFMMPSHYNLTTLPIPNNPEIKLIKVPQKKFITIRFSGRSSQKNIQKNENELINYIHTKGMKVKPLPIYAFYNPPWTLPILRRNEIMFEILAIKKD